jgi:hypothetical protein
VWEFGRPSGAKCVEGTVDPGLSPRAIVCTRLRRFPRVSRRPVCVGDVCAFGAFHECHAVRCVSAMCVIGGVCRWWVGSAGRRVQIVGGCVKIGAASFA